MWTAQQLWWWRWLLLRRALLLVLASACTPDEATLPPTIAEPAIGARFDRALVRARINRPTGLDSVPALWAGAQNAGHAKWRVDEGTPVEPLDFTSYGYEEPADYAFAVHLTEGTHRLSLARCTEIDDCGWTSRDVEVVIGSGSPDPAFARVGQAAIRTLDIAASFLPIDGGMVLVAGGDRIAAIGADGVPVPGFGTTGMIPYNPSLGYPMFARGTDNTTVIVWMLVTNTTSSATFARLSNTGVLSGQVTMALPNGLVVASGGTLTTATGGGFWLGCDVRRPDNVVVPAIMRVDDSGGVTAITELDTVPGIGASEAWYIAPDGRFAMMGGMKAVMGTAAAGLDTTFAIAGGYPVTYSYANTIALHGDGIAVIRNELGVAKGVDLVSHSGAMRTIALPLQEVVSLAAAGPNTLYVSGVRAQVIEQSGLHADKIRPGTDTAVARITSGTLDTSFGASGIAWSSGRLLFQPISTEAANDLPQLIGIDASGPYVASVSYAYTGEFYVSRNPIVTLTRFRP